MSTTIHNGASGAAAWTLAEGRPRDLAGLVESIWFFDGRAPSKRERHFPTGTLDLIVHLDDERERFRIVEGEPKGACPVASVGGLLVEPMVIEAPPGRCGVLGARLTPAGARALLGMPLSELTGRTVELSDVMGAAARELVDLCGEARGGSARVRAAERWLRTRLRCGRPTHAGVAAAVRAIEGSRGAVKMSALRARLGVSKARLASSFREQIGVTPKRFARIVRFRHAAASLREGAHGLSDLALACGYYDQAHMNAEFRALSGVSPLAFRAATRPHQESLAGD